MLMARENQIIRTADICDNHRTDARICETQFRDVGGRSHFHGVAICMSAYENNSGLLFVISNNDSGGRSSSSDDMEVESIQDESMVAVEDATAVDTAEGDNNLDARVRGLLSEHLGEVIVTEEVSKLQQDIASHHNVMDGTNEEEMDLLSAQFDALQLTKNSCLDELREKRVRLEKELGDMDAIEQSDIEKYTDLVDSYTGALIKASGELRVLINSPQFNGQVDDDNFIQQLEEKSQEVMKLFGIMYDMETPSDDDAEITNIHDDHQCAIHDAKEWMEQILKAVCARDMRTIIDIVEGVEVQAKKKAKQSHGKYTSHEEWHRFLLRHEGESFEEMREEMLNWTLEKYNEEYNNMGKDASVATRPSKHPIYIWLKKNKKNPFATCNIVISGCKLGDLIDTVNHAARRNLSFIGKEEVVILRLTGGSKPQPEDKWWYDVLTKELQRHVSAINLIKTKHRDTYIKQLALDELEKAGLVRANETAYEAFRKNGLHPVSIRV